MNDARSVTKSVVSTLVGIAIAKGLLPGVTARIDKYLDPPHVAGLDSAKRAITVENLLTMSSGFEWNESTTAAYNDWVLSADPIAYLLQRHEAAQTMPPVICDLFGVAGAAAVQS